MITRRNFTLAGSAAAAAAFVQTMSSGTVAAATAEIAAVKAELERGLAELRLDGKPAPYHVEVRLLRIEQLLLDGSYGGVITDQLGRQGVGTVTIRVGTPDSDNANFLSGSPSVSFELPLTPDGLVTRKRLWLAMDGAYRNAVAAYDAKQKALQNYSGVKPPDGLAPGPGAATRLSWATPESAEAIVDPEIRPMELDRKGLRSIAADLSARYKNTPRVDNGDVVAWAVRAYETLITSEGTIIGSVTERAALVAVADMRATDGMPIDHGEAIHLTRFPSDLTDLRKQGEALVDRVIAEIVELADAPMLEEDYDGPLLLGPQASAEFLASTLAVHAAAVPAPLTDYGRAVDLEPYLLERLGQAVMPSWIDVVDDPSAEGFGRYEYDGDGIKAVKLNLVQGGILTELLRGRVRADKEAKSNGRNRTPLGGGGGTAISNMTLQPRKPGLSQAKMEAEIFARAAEDGWKHAYLIESFRDGTVLGPVGREGANAYGSGRKISLPIPGRIFKIEPGGKRTLVRGAVVGPASIRLLRRIRAVGDKPLSVAMRVPSGLGGGFAADAGLGGLLTQTVDVEVRTPALLLDGIELLVERGEHERLPYLVHPLRRGAAEK